MLLNWEEQGVARMLKHPASLVSLSDAGAHLTFFNDAGFGLHLLGHWVRRLGVLTLEEAARRLTSQPAPTTKASTRRFAASSKPRARGTSTPGTNGSSGFTW